jgi:hypothetical protein
MDKINSYIYSGAKYMTMVSLVISIFLVSMLGGELHAQQRGTISVDRAAALPLTTA